MKTYGDLIINAGTVNAVSTATGLSNISFIAASPSEIRMNGGVLNISGGKSLVTNCKIYGTVTASKKAGEPGVDLSDPNAVSGSTEYVFATVVPFKSRNISVGTITNGTVTVDKTTGKCGDTVTVTTAPAKNYKTDSVIVKDASGGSVEVTQEKTDETYTFTMPDSDVTVTAEFITPVTVLVDSVNGDDSVKRAEGATYQTVAGALKQIKDDDTIKLVSDVNEDVVIEKVSITIDLNGCVIKGTGTDAVITSDGDLTIMDSKKDTVHYFRVDTNGMWVLDTTATQADYTYSTAEGLKKNGKASDDIPAANSVIAVSGGCITGGKSNLVGGLFTSVLSLQGGNIVGNRGVLAGGLGYVEGALTMTGGSIIGNYSKETVGGVYGTFAKLTGGRISYNSGAYGGFVDGYPSEKSESKLSEDEKKELEENGYRIYGNYRCLLNVGGSIVIDNNVGGNLITLGVFGIYSDDDAPVSGMNIGVTLADESEGEIVIKSGRFAANGTAAYAGYFTSDSQFYQVNYDDGGYLKLDYIMSQITEKTLGVTLKDDAMTSAEAITVATEQKPYSGLSKSTVIAYAKADDFDASGKYQVITANSSSDWQTGEAMTLAEMMENLSNNDYFVIGLTTEHDHSWTYELSGTVTDNDTVTAVCEGDTTCNYSGSDKSLTISAPASLKYDGNKHDATFGKATTFLGASLPTITYQYKASATGVYAAAENTVQAGYYKASFTVGTGAEAKTAYVEYVVTEEKSNVNSTTADKPSTGDHNNMWLYIVLASAALLVCIGAVAARKLRRR